ncbi:MAG: membrane dipeptidase, partial [Pigmentiphaga sp.]
NYFLKDKGIGRQLLQPKGAVFPEDFHRIEQYPNLTRALARRGWPESRIAAFMGENWLRFFDTVWHH